MDTIHQQVAVLQQKIDYLIDQLATLTGDSHLPHKSVRRSSLTRERIDIPDTASDKSIGLNRYRALQAKQ